MSFFFYFAIQWLPHPLALGGKEGGGGEDIQGSIKKEEEFPGVIKKKYVEFQWFQWILVFGFGISKGSDTIFGNLQC